MADKEKREDFSREPPRESPKGAPYWSGGPRAVVGAPVVAAVEARAAVAPRGGKAGGWGRGIRERRARAPMLVVTIRTRQRPSRAPVHRRAGASILPALVCCTHLPLP